MALIANCCPVDRPPAAIAAAAARPTTTFLGFNAPRAAPAPSALPGLYPEMPSIHFGIDPSSPVLGRLRNFRNAATKRYTPRTNFSAPAHVEWPEPADRLTAPAMETNKPSTTATPAMNPTRKLMALTRGLVVNNRRIAGMMLSGEMVTTNA